MKLSVMGLPICLACFFICLMTNGPASAGDGDTNKSGFSFTNMVVTRVTLSTARNCSKCGAQANVFADINAASDDPHHQTIINYCDRCAFTEIPKLPPCSRMMISALTQPQQRTAVKERYEVLKLLKEENLADIKVLTVDEQPVTTKTFRVRLDALPENFRAVGEKLSVAGSDLELNLFEQCGRQDGK